MEIIYSTDTRAYSSRFKYKNILVLFFDNWNDYNYYTSFFAVYYDYNSKEKGIGALKIYCKQMENDISIKRTASIRDYLEKKITTLGDSFCSLGQDLSFYSSLMIHCPDDYRDILVRLRDISYNPKLSSDFEGCLGFKKSLLRNSSAFKAYKEAYLMINEAKREANLSFRYKAIVSKSNVPIELDFDFSGKSKLPNRVHVIVGKNGTGKTTILTNLADTLSGYRDSINGIETGFIGERPAFDRVVSISYSAFDHFKTRGDRTISGICSYVYCGIQSENGTLSLDKLSEIFHESLDVIYEKNRVSIWENVLKELLDEKQVHSLENNHFNDKIDEIQGSSGQNILICMITEVISKIERESIILFDEPETHLHPNAIANVIRMLNRLLEQFNSYAIIATHSPLIVQETPSEFVQILSRIDDIPYVRKPDIECFGNNITNITNEIFDVNSTESNYKSTFKNLSEHMSFDEIIDLFHGELSLNARIYLKNCCKEE